MSRSALAASLLLLAAVPAAAEPGLTAVPFIQRPLGARAAAMGSAFTAVAGALDVAQYNPAGLAVLPMKSFTSTYLQSFGGTNYGYFAYGHPTPYGTFAAGVLYFNAGSMDLNLSDGTQRSVTSEEDTAFNLSYARELPMGFMAGATYRRLRSSLADTVQTSSNQGDFGLVWRSPLKGLSFGAAYLYMGQNVTYEEAGDPPPRTVRYGAAYRAANIPIASLDPSIDTREFDMTLSADMVETLHEKRSPRAGMEMGLEPAFLDRFAVRFGWIFERDAESFTAGLGCREGRFLLDYAFGLSKNFDPLQQLTLSFQF